MHFLQYFWLNKSVLEYLFPQSQLSLFLLKGINEIGIELDFNPFAFIHLFALLAKTFHY